MRRCCIFAIVFAGSTCSRPPSGDAANVPRLGRWTSTSELASVTVNGTTTLGANIPDDVAETVGGRSSVKELECAEPRITGTEPLTIDLPPTLTAVCRFITTADDGINVAFTTECDPSTYPADIANLQFTGEALVLPDSVDLRLTVDVRTKAETGASDTARVVQKRSFRRVGVCSG